VNVNLMKPTGISRRPLLILALIVVANGLLTIAAMRRTSTTFDEIVMMAGGARGLHTGMWDMAPEHPPFTQYVYGIPVFFAHPDYPDESNISAPVKKMMAYRYAYASEFFFKDGVATEKLVFLGRLPAAIIGMLLVVLGFFFTRWAAGDRAAILAAAIIAFLPDVLAHGGVAYNDVPVAAAVFGAVWLIDRALRQPSIPRGIVAGLSIGLALGVKNSAVALGPVALVLLAVSIAAGWRDPVWRRRIVPAALCTLAGAYVALVIIYRGDFMLREYQYAVNFAVGHVTQVSRAPSYLLGQRSMQGWWYFFPLAFLFKTSAGLHVLMLVSLTYYATAIRRTPAAILTSRLRAPFVALLVFGALLLTSKLDIGFRYALPSLPFIAVLTAAGVARAWDLHGPRVRVLVIAATIWMIGQVASYFPNYLAYVSEYGPGRDENYQVFADSSLDWGQGLIQLREFLHEHGIERVYLSFFGSASPQAYGIDYVPLASFYPLKPIPGAESRRPPEWAVVSATNLTGTYFVGDPFAQFRNARPDFVVAHTMFVYHLSADSAGVQK
jgi:hypothetical protein